MDDSPGGFRYEVRRNGDVVIKHNGRLATTLRAGAAAKFLAEVETSDEQALMARLTGNYKRGNERRARSHPRNRGQ